MPDFPFFLLSAVVSVQFVLICALAREAINRDRCIDRLNDQQASQLKELRAFQIETNSALDKLRFETKTLIEKHEELKESRGKNPPVYLAAPENRIDGDVPK